MVCSSQSCFIVSCFVVSLIGAVSPTESIRHVTQLLHRSIICVVPMSPIFTNRCRFSRYSMSQRVALFHPLLPVTWQVCQVVDQVVPIASVAFIDFFQLLSDRSLQGVVAVAYLNIIDFFQLIQSFHPVTSPYHLIHSTTHQRNIFVTC